MRLFLATLAVMLAAPAVAADTAPAAAAPGEITVTGTPTPKNTDSRDPNKIVCKGDVETGSLVRKKKRCLTRAQWAEEERNARRDFDDAQRRELIRQQMMLPKPGPTG